MRLDRFDLNLLVFLDALLEERNVTKAGERLHITQPSASGALARLREYFGDDLLLPVGRRLELTPLGRSLVRPVRDTLLKARSTLALKPGFAPATASCRFTICASDYVIAVFLGDLVASLAQEAPGLALDLRCPGRDVLTTFERGSVDLLIMPEQLLAPVAGSPAPLLDDRQVCMIWAGSTRTGSQISLDEYLSAGHVALRLGEELSLAFETWLLPRSGARRRIECSVDHFAALPALVVGTDRVATLHRRIAERYASQYPLRLLEPTFDMPRTNEAMAWPHHFDDDPAHQWLRDRVLAAATSLVKF